MQDLFTSLYIRKSEKKKETMKDMKNERIKKKKEVSFRNWIQKTSDRNFLLQFLISTLFKFRQFVVFGLCKRMRKIFSRKSPLLVEKKKGKEKETYEKWRKGHFLRNWIHKILSSSQFWTKLPYFINIFDFILSRLC